MKLQQFQVITVSFNPKITDYQLSEFRRAFLSKLSHQSLIIPGITTQTREAGYQYPALQFKTSNGYPLIMVVNKGIEQLEQFFSQKPHFLLNDGNTEIRTHEAKVQTITLQIAPRTFAYELNKWLPLTAELYAHYMQAENEEIRIELLRYQLTKQLEAFCKNCGWTPTEAITVQFSEAPKVFPVTINTQKRLAFSLRFTANLFLPNFIGIGQNAGLGFGTLRNVKH